MELPLQLFLYTTHLNHSYMKIIPCFACDAPCCKLRIQPHKKYDPKESWVKKLLSFFSYYTLLKWDTGVEYKIGLFMHRERVRHVCIERDFLFNLVMGTKDPLLLRFGMLRYDGVKVGFVFGIMSKKITILKSLLNHFRMAMLTCFFLAK